MLFKIYVVAHITAHYVTCQLQQICNIYSLHETRHSMHAEVANNLKFPPPYGQWTVLSCFKALFTANLKKPPPGTSQVQPNLDPTSVLEL